MMGVAARHLRWKTSLTSRSSGRRSVWLQLAGASTARLNAVVTRFMLSAIHIHITGTMLLLLISVCPARAAVQTVDQWSVETDSSITSVTLGGIWPDSCSRPISAQTTAVARSFTILVPPVPLPPSANCTGALARWSLTIPLGRLTDGQYSIQVLSYGSPEPPSAPGTIASLSFFVADGTATSAQPIPTLAPHFLALMIVVITLAMWTLRVARNRASRRPPIGATSTSWRSHGAPQRGR